MKPRDVPPGKPCEKCGSTRRSEKRGECMDCHRARAAARHRADPTRGKATKAAWAKANREHRKAQRALWYKANAEKEKAAAAARRKADPDKYKALLAAWRQANPERIKATQRAWYDANIEYIRERDAKKRETRKERDKALAIAWQKANPEKVRTLTARRRALIAKAVGDHTVQQWLDLLASYHGKCVYCGAAANTQDHLTPLSEGGSNDIDNIVPSCRYCNYSKHANKLLVWMVKRKTIGRPRRPEGVN